jgi:hypothetical protein
MPLLLAAYCGILGMGVALADSLGSLQFALLLIERLLCLASLLIDLAAFGKFVLSVVVLASRSLVALAFVTLLAGLGFVCHATSVAEFSIVNGVAPLVLRRGKNFSVKRLISAP